MTDDAEMTEVLRIVRLSEAHETRTDPGPEPPTSVKSPRVRVSNVVLEMLYWEARDRFASLKSIYTASHEFLRQYLLDRAPDVLRSLHWTLEMKRQYPLTPEVRRLAISALMSALNEVAPREPPTSVEVVA